MPGEVHEDDNVELFIPLAHNIKESSCILLLQLIFGDDKVSDCGFSPRGLFEGTIYGNLFRRYCCFLLFRLLLLGLEEDLEHDEERVKFFVEEEVVLDLYCVLLECGFVLGVRALNLQRHYLYGLGLLILAQQTVIEGHQLLLIVLNRLVEGLEDMGCVEEPLHSVLVDLYLLFQLELVVQGEQGQHTRQLPLKGLQYQGRLRADGDGLYDWLVLYLEDVQQPFHDEVQLLLHLLVLQFPAQDRSEPALSR